MTFMEKVIFIGKSGVAGASMAICAFALLSLFIPVPAAGAVVETSALASSVVGSLTGAIVAAKQ